MWLCRQKFLTTKREVRAKRDIKTIMNREKRLLEIAELRVQNFLIPILDFPFFNLSSFKFDDKKEGRFLKMRTK